MTKIERQLKQAIQKSLSYFPAVCILGPRQCGKTTLAKEIISSFPSSIYLDLELESDINKLKDPEYYLKKYQDVLICLDEIQRLPEIFPLLRALIDQKREPARFLILGSASQDLIKQSTESLAGRISYHELTPFTQQEILEEGKFDHHWIHGGFPGSYCAPVEDISIEWKESFIRTFLERDLYSLDFNLPAPTMKRFWVMLAHQHSSLLNKASLANSLGVSATTIQRWQDIFEQTFMIRVLQPFSSNLKKRLVKSPKIYIRDSGLLHQLLNLSGFDTVLSHSIAGASWEGYAIENIITELKKWSPSFYRTSNGSEIDLILEKGNTRVGVEFKLSSAPKIEKGTYNAMEDLGLDLIHVVIPKGEGEQIRQDLRIDSIASFVNFMQR
jgi:predicted AAA+ superfamily ATPase